MRETIAIAGGGTMGAGIACVAAAAGYAVEVIEPSEPARERAAARIARSAERSGDPSLLERIVVLPALPERSAAIVGIEAVPERFDLKVETLAKLAAALGERALLATNTSSFSVEELTAHLPHPERALGLHFFNPPEAMALVEVVRAPLTGEDTLDRALAFVRGLGKTPVLAADAPGFVVNRVARPYYLQALRALEAGVAEPGELDALARSAGFRMGPFELMDLIGLDVNLATTQSVFARTQAERLAPVELQEAMVAQGRLGRKSGRGFYEYADGVPQRIEAAIEPSGEPPIDDECVALIGFGPFADELATSLERAYGQVVRVENDDLLDELPTGVTIAFDAGDGLTDRTDAIAALEERLDPSAVVFVDAYATDLHACARRMQRPDRLVGYGVLGSLGEQRAIEIVDADATSDDALELAQELFERIGKAPVLVADRPGLFLGRCVGSIVNEAVTVVQEEIAQSDDVDLAMRLGTNYPRGPLEWGRAIGGRRIAAILARLARSEGSAFAPHRALWVLDVEDESEDLVAGDAP